VYLPLRKISQMPTADHLTPASSSANEDWLQPALARLQGKSVEELDEQVGAASVGGTGATPGTEALPTTSARTSWELGAYVETGSNASVNAYARAEVAGGAEALLYRLYQQPNDQDIEDLLRGIDAERVSLHCTLRYPGQERQLRPDQNARVRGFRSPARLV